MEGLCCKITDERTGSLKAPKWRLDRRSSNGGRPSPSSFFARFAGIYAIRFRCEMWKSCWRSAALPSTTPRFGAGSSAKLPSSSSGSVVI
jgi:hypothetical protein